MGLGEAMGINFGGGINFHPKHFRGGIRIQLVLCIGGT